MTTSKWWLGGAAGAAVVSILVACAPPAVEDTGASGDRITTGTFDKNELVTDEALLDKNALSATQIQAFLDKTPWNTKSVLAAYTEDGQSAAQIISTVSQKYGVNPIALLVRVQMEQSLLYKATATDSTIKIAFGCGCPHSSICSAKYEGFANQADCAAGTLSRSIAAATTSTGTASGWKKGVVKMTVDKVNVNPANAATAALYTYTPYVGEAGGGEKGVGGASLHKQVWDKVTTTLSYTPSTRSATTGSATTPATSTSTDDAGTTPDDGDDDTDPDDTTGTADAGTTTSPSTPTTPSKPTASKPPATSADDASLLHEGNAPPVANNVPLPQASGSHKGTSSSSGTTTGASASADDSSSSRSSSSNSESSSSPSADDSTPTTKKPVASGGCSSTGRSGGGNGILAGISVAIVGLLGRRRRR